MARAAKDTRLDRKSARIDKLKAGRRYYKEIGEGLTLVYRRTKEGYGTWSAKLAMPAGKYAVRVLGAADDLQDADDVKVLTFFQAQAKAREIAHNAKINAGIIIQPQTVAEAATDYMTWFRAHRKSVDATEHSVNVHILPALRDIRLDELTGAQIKQWLDALGVSPARVRASAKATKPKHRAAPKTADAKRARKATANRVFNILKAILNYAFQNERVGSDAAWRKVKPFAKVDEARIRFLTDEEATRLVSASPADLRTLINAALLTGARFGELARLTTGDVAPAHISITESKSGRPRKVPLNAAGTAFFAKLTEGKASSALVLTKKDGTEWGKNHHVRGLEAACKVAEIQPPISFHELRHTYASHLAQAGVDLLTISKLLGHADTRITAKHYAHLADKTLAAAVMKLPSYGAVPKPPQRAALRVVS